MFLLFSEINTFLLFSEKNVHCCFFQADESMAGYLHTEMIRLLRKFMGKFVKTKTISAAKDITEVEFMKTEHQHPDEILAFGVQGHSWPTTLTYRQKKSSPSTDQHFSNLLHSNQTLHSTGLALNFKFLLVQYSVRSVNIIHKFFYIIISSVI